MKKVISILIGAALIISLSVLMTACGKDEPAQEKQGAEPAQEEQAEKPAQEEAAKEDAEKAEQPGDDSVEPEEEEATKEEVRKVSTDNITINTQSSIKIKGSKTVYFDPYKIADAPHDADLILITHAHYDHFDAPSLKNVAGKHTFVVCPDSMEKDVRALGIGTLGFASMEAGAVIKPEADLAGITIEAVPAYNLNKNFHPKANGWLGYVLEMDGVRYYAAGDTDALPELEDVKCDIAMVPIGGTYTMTAAEAAGLINKIKPEVAVPIHYGTIVGRASDADKFKAAVEDSIKVVTKVKDAK